MYHLKGTLVHDQLVRVGLRYIAVLIVMIRVVIVIGSWGWSRWSLGTIQLRSRPFNDRLQREFSDGHCLKHAPLEAKALTSEGNGTVLVNKVMWPFCSG